jgi:hypothetical protein
MLGLNFNQAKTNSATTHVFVLSARVRTEERLWSTLNTNDILRPTFGSMIGENRQLVTNELVEFEKYPVEVQNCKKNIDHFRGIYRIYPI